MNESHSTSLTWNGKPIRSWAKFQRVVKGAGTRLLARLPRFPDAVLVAGCQRSGTTALRRTLTRAEGMTDHRFGRDDELDAALMLSGYVDRPLQGRACFQTTYLNDRYREYFEHDDFRLIWLLREPASVVFSMLHNWRSGALRRLFDACGRPHLYPAGTRHARRWFGPSRFEQACAAYVGKTIQTFELAERLGERIFIVEYDELVLRKAEVLPEICRFSDLSWRDELLEGLHGKSVRHSSKLTERQAEHVERFCSPVYLEARALVTRRSAAVGSAACAS